MGMGYMGDGDYEDGAMLPSALYTDRSTPPTPYLLPE